MLTRDPDQMRSATITSYISKAAVTLGNPSFIGVESELRIMANVLCQTWLSVLDCCLLSGPRVWRESPVYEKAVRGSHFGPVR
jgi:hypothetical protein